VIPIPGAKSAKQAQENAGAMTWSLTPQEVETLEVVSRPWLA
jgi:aryl-alcohol dehydrogenase-like predicted oxidoreductase